MKPFIFVACAIFATSCRARNGPAPFVLHVEFSQSVALKPGDQVCMLGVPVGKVERITISQSGSDGQPVVNVEASLSDSKVRLRKADTFRIATEGLLGKEYLEIDPAKVQSPPVADGSTVTGEAATFPPKFVTYMQPLMEIAKKLEGLPPADRRLMIARFLKLLDEGSQNTSHRETGQSGKKTD